jgi:Domain of unknown function (DUF6985)
MRGDNGEAFTPSQRTAVIRARARDGLTERERAQLAADEERLTWSNFFPASMAPIYRRQEALKNKPVVVKLPPMPPMTLTLNEWVGQDVLKSWAGFGEKRGSKGKIGIQIPRPWKDDDDTNPVPPVKEMLAAYAHLREHEVEVRDAVLAAFQSYLNNALSAKDERRITDAKMLKRMLRIISVHPSTVARSGMSYLGLFLRCTWDPEHAAGVMLHGSRVIKVGDNEAAGDDAAAIEDGGKRLRAWQR